MGTGHKPTIPLLLAICGAESVHTVDLHVRLQMNMMTRVIDTLLSREQMLTEEFSTYVPMKIVRDRFELLRIHRREPQVAFHEFGIHYLAPADAADLDLGDNVIDVHFSTATLEHIPPSILVQIMREAKRLIIPSGMAIHFIDLSDHYAHQDERITRSNFLRYSTEEWERLADNEFGYCNRLRVDDYLSIFKQAGFSSIRIQTRIDQESLQALQSGHLKVHSDLGHFEPLTLATDELGVALVPEDTGFERSAVD